MGAITTIDLQDGDQLVGGESVVTLYRHAIEPRLAADVACELSSALDWERGSVVVYGKEHRIPRDTCWYGPVEYHYSGLRHPAAAWHPVLVPLRLAVEDALGVELPSVLGNRYRNGDDRVAWHADDEPIFGQTPVIASLSFGTARTFQLRRKDRTGERIDAELTAGSLVVMRGDTQLAYEHCVPRRARVVGERINLTFRTLDAASQRPQDQVWRAG
jgi:alkylated DNA repair dioxygenase AlkB